jgi:hypothetical protein
MEKRTITSSRKVRKFDSVLSAFRNILADWAREEKALYLREYLRAP